MEIKLSLSRRLFSLIGACIILIASACSNNSTNFTGGAKNRRTKQLPVEPQGENVVINETDDDDDDAVATPAPTPIPVDRPLSWDSIIADFSHPEDVPLSRVVAASDPDTTETPVYSMDTGNMTCDDGAWSPQISIDPATGAISGIPTNADVGNCTVRVAATLGADTITADFTITVVNSNDYPAWITTISDFSHPEDAAMTITARAADSDAGETPTYSIDPANSTCDDGSWSPAITIDSASGVITGTPHNGDVGQCRIRVVATSGGDSIYDDFNVTVVDVNDAPVWTTVITDFSHPEDSPLSKTVRAVDVDAGDVPTYAIDLPAMTCDNGSWSPQISIHPNTGVLTGTPRNDDVGTCTVKVIATSGTDVIFQEFTITVTNVNDLPVWVTWVSDFSHPEDTPVSVNVQAVDVDAGEVPTYTLDYPTMTCDNGSWNPPISINATSGAITGTPTNADVGTCTVKVKATSGADSITQQFTITVKNANDMPRWANVVADFSHPEDAPISVSVQAIDDDPGETPVYALDLPGMTCDDGTWSPQIAINTTTGAITGTPRNGDIGDCTVNVTATSGGDTIFQEFTITVTNTNDAPTWVNTLPNFTHPEDVPFSATAEAIDADPGQTPTYSFVAGSMTCDNGSWSPQISIHSTTGAITGTPHNGDVGTCSVRVRATSGGDSITQDFTITVTNTNDVPVWLSTIPDMTIAEDTPLLVTAQASDPDAGQTPTYALDLGATTCDDGSWSPQIIINPATGAISGTPHNDDVGTCTVRVIATSGTDTIYDDFNVTVTNTNDPPAWVSTLPDVTIAEGSPLMVSADAMDPDPGETPTYGLDLANMSCDNGTWSPQITINPTSGNIGGVPHNGDVGSCTVRVSATSGGDTIYDIFTVTVTNINDAPVWDSLVGDFSHPEDTPLSVAVQASDPDAGETPTYALDTSSMSCDDGSWSPQIAINSTTGVITGTPRNDDVGNCTVTVIATSGGDTITQSFTITVTNTNDLPVWINTIPNTTVAQDTAISVTAQADDPDAGQTPVYSLDLPGMTCDNGTWSPQISINSTTGVISGIPHNSDVGTCTVKVVATSGGDSITQQFTVTVTNANDPPYWVATLPDITVPEDTSINAIAQAADPDPGDTPTYTLDLPNMTCDDGSWSPQIAINTTTGAISGTPRNADVGSCTVRIVGESNGQYIYDEFTVTVTNTNDLPAWVNTIPDMTVPEDTPISVTAQASDPDVGQTPTYSLDTSAMTCDNGSWSPQIAINPTTGDITGTPTNGDVGSCTVRVVATSGGDSINQQFTVTVTNSNDPPYWIATLPDVTIVEDTSLAATAQAADPDPGETPGYSLDLNNMTCDDGTWSPQISISPVTGMITGIPTNSDVGSCTVRVEASSGGDTIYDDFTVTITNANDPPAWINLLPDVTIVEDTAFTATAQATDPDVGQTPTYAFDLPNMSCDNGSWSPQIAIDTTTGVISGIPTNGDVGSCTVKIIATSAGDSISQQFTITVTNVNDPPTWVALLPDVAVDEDTMLNITAAALDPDVGETPTYALDLPAMDCDNGSWSPQISINGTTGVISGIPRNDDVGTCTVVVIATSAGDSISDEFNVTVTNVNDLPTWVSTLPDVTILEDVSFSATAQAIDVDAGETPSYALDLSGMTCDNGTWSPQISINSSTGVISGTPHNGDVGNCTVKVVATSGADTITDQFTITVTDTNDLPTWISTIADFSTTEDTPISVTASATDPDPGDTPVYSLDTANTSCDDGAWSPQISINAITGVITGTPHNADVGTCNVRVVATSGGDTIYDDFTITVTNANDIPYWLVTISDFSHPEDTPISKLAQAVDPDPGETPVYSLNFSNMTCDNGSWSPAIAINPSTGAITGTPTNNDVGICSVEVVATSGGDTIYDQFNITITNSNDVPTWYTLVNDFSIPQDTPVNVTISATDIDPGETPTYAFDNGGMTCDDGTWSPQIFIDSATGEITGTPRVGDVGSCTVKVNATSGADTISHTFTITVTPVNHGPTWDNIVSDFSQPTYGAMSVTVTATDIDPGDTVTYSLDFVGMTCDDGDWSPQLDVDSATGEITGTPTFPDVGDCTIKVQATSGGDTISQEFTVNITNTVQTVEQTFPAATTGSNSMNFSLSDTWVEQTLDMHYNTSNETRNFTQIVRPTRMDVFNQGFGGTSETESFNQTNVGVVDIVLVVDNSGSMAEEQLNLSTKLGSLLTNIDDSSWQIGIVTTDPSDGCLRSLIKKTDPDPATAFAAAVQPGVSGSNNERGIQTAVMALEGACLPQPWLRDASSVAVLILSDEDNCNTMGLGCPGQPWETESHLLDYLNGIRTVGVDARVYGLIWHPSHDSGMCPTADFQGEAYANAVSASSGAWGSICDLDYSATLEAISNNIADTLKDQFQLVYDPDPGSVEVRVDGVLQGGGYTIAGKIVTFTTPPPDGSIVDIFYIHGGTQKFTKWTLTDVPVESTLEVTFDGSPVGSGYSFAAGTNEIVFSSMPPDNTEIRVTYKKDVPLQSAYDIGMDVVPGSISATIDGTSTSNFTYNSGTGILTFGTAPPDGAAIVIDFTRNGAPVLSYAVTLPPTAELGSIELTDFDTGVPVAGNYISGTGTIDFPVGEFSDGRRIRIRFQDPGINPDEFQLAHTPLPGTTVVNGGVSICIEPGGTADVVGDKLVLTGCTIKPALTSIDVDYDFVVEYYTSFTVAGAAGLPPGHPQTWTVWIDDVETTNYTRSTNVVTLPAALPHTSVVRIMVDFPQHN